jgi:RimJ/RimL family protein N-acetyltransferase
MRLEGKEVMDEHFIRQVEVVPDEELPLLLLAQLVDGTVVTYIDEACPIDLQKELMENQVEFPHLECLLDILRRKNIPFNVGHYKTYIFPSTSTADTDVRCLSKDDFRVKSFGFDGFAEEVYTVERNDRIVSACVSTRENKTCGEAWVYTDPEHRHQGLAQKLVRAWAGSLMGAGKVPFYSHSIENTASANLARKLGLQLVFEEISITPISRHRQPHD